MTPQGAGRRLRCPMVANTARAQAKEWDEEEAKLRAENDRLTSALKQSSLDHLASLEEIERLKGNLRIAEGVIERNEASIKALTGERDEAMKELLAYRESDPERLIRQVEESEDVA